MRAALRSIRAAALPHVVNNFEDVGSENIETQFAVSKCNPFSTNLVFVSPEKIPEVYADRSGYFRHRLNVGCWSWELPSIPEEWRASFPYFHEIWVPSTYIREAVSKVSPVPVVTMPHAIDTEALSKLAVSRHRLGLPREAFVFLFMFDFHSTVERKNPMGVIQAFRKTFGNRTDAFLLIKSMHAESAGDEFLRLKGASGGANVRFLDAVMSREASLSLMAACDCYVSLHRSEGFGLTLAEAMALGKPVIATGYSGNLDFTNNTNSFLVRHRLATIEQDYGPYRKGSLWAEPDLDHAADLLWRVFSDRGNAAKVASQGRADILRRLHPAVIGAQMRDRLLAATQEEAVRRSLEISQAQEQLDKRTRELMKVRADLQQRSQELQSAQQELEARPRASSLISAQREVEKLQTEVSNLDDRLHDEQALRQALQEEFHLLRYRTADRINSLVKSVPGLHSVAKLVLSGMGGWRNGRNKKSSRAISSREPGREQWEEMPQEVFEVERAQLPAPKFAAGPAPPIPLQTAAFAGCTIVAPNYLAHARVLARSFQKHNPGCPFFVLIMGRVNGYFDPRQEPFLVIETDSLRIPAPEDFFFKYNVLEASTAVKPYFLDHLFRQHQLGKLVYVDPDILVTDSLARLSSLLDKYAIVLTPHLTAPIGDNLHPGEFQILQAGTYNLGFIALRNCEASERMISWWQEKVYHQCLMAPERGMHVDQKWMDLAPGLFEGVGILREPGYNVAYWNLHARAVTIQNEEILVNGHPCYFFHFSGFDPRDIEAVSRHQNRFRLESLGEARVLFERYRDALLAAGWQDSKLWPYSYDYFENGARVPDVARRMYWSLGGTAAKFDNPFQTQRDSFFQWLNAPVDGERDPSRLVTRLWYEIYRRRSDLLKVFPDVLGVHREAFLRWIREKDLKEFGVCRSFLPRSRPVQPKHPRQHRGGRREDSKPTGINVLGYVQSEKGMGEAVRADIRSLEAAGIPYVVNDFKDPFAANIEEAPSSLARTCPYAINLFHVNADQVPVLLEQKKKVFECRYNIGYWTWELSNFPKEWTSHFAHFNEVWVPSTFVQEAVARVSPIPVICVPHAINPQPDVAREWTRARFGLGSESFVFLFSFDFYSFMERKNPLGLVRAFKQAFGDRPDVSLIIKCSHSDWAREEMLQLRQACQDTNIQIQDAVWPRKVMNALFAACDCYVSLHRSEGFGLTLAEAMAFGKPVVATAYSGNLDFMREGNSFLVRYKLVELERDYGPYKKGSVWAEPDIDHAVHVLRSIVLNRDVTASVASQGKEDVLARLHPRAIGTLIRKRLLETTREDKLAVTVSN